ncbi:MAG: alpha/beta hydrolase [Bryobacteraceae bacterium]
MRIVYLHGFASGPASRKAMYFRDRFAGHGIDLATPDLCPGNFEDLTITSQLAAVEQAAPEILIGSSLGGYLAALYAARHPEVGKVVLMAPAFAFTKRWPETLGAERVAAWRATGWLDVFHYGAGAMRRLGYQLIEDGARYEDFPDVRQPALILHGREDPVVPARYSEEFASGRPSARLVLFDSGHELTDVLEPMWAEIRSFLLQ